MTPELTLTLNGLSPHPRSVPSPVPVPAASPRCSQPRRKHVSPRGRKHQGRDSGCMTIPGLCVCSGDGAGAPSLSSAPSSHAAQCGAAGPSACGQCSPTCVTQGGKRQGAGWGGGGGGGVRIIVPTPWGFPLPSSCLVQSRRMWVTGMRPPQGEGDVGLRHVGATLSLSPDGIGAPKDGDTPFPAPERVCWGSMQQYRSSSWGSLWCPQDNAGYPGPHIPMSTRWGRVLMTPRFSCQHL